MTKIALIPNFLKTSYKTSIIIYMSKILAIQIFKSLKY